MRPAPGRTHPGTCFPASSPRDRSLPVLSRPKQKHHLASTLLLGNAIRRDSQLYALVPSPPPPSVNTAPLPALRPPPRRPRPPADNRPHLLSLRLPRPFTNAAKLFAVTTVVIGQSRPRAARARPPQLALSDGSCSFLLREAADNCCGIRWWNVRLPGGCTTEVLCCGKSASGQPCWYWKAQTTLGLVMTVSGLSESYF